jgi:hydrogenase-1 operon protein HyaE
MTTPLHPLVERLVEQGRARAVDADTAAAWAARPGEHLLFFSGDALRFPEAADVAVVLPELAAAFGGRFDLGVVPRAAEDALARRWGVQRWPSLVLLRDGGWVATLSGMKDWSDFVAELGQALQQPATRAPSVGIPVVAAGAAEPACH